MPCPQAYLQHPVACKPPIPSSSSFLSPLVFARSSEARQSLPD
jgi:hypothetical protein